MVVTQYKRPDTYLNEVLAPAVSDTGISMSTSVLVGTNARGPLAATLVTSWAQFTSLYGGFIPGTVPSDLQYAVYLHFLNGGRQLYVIRVVQGSEVAASAALLDREAGGSTQTTLTVTAVNPGTWGNKVSYGISDSATVGYFDLTVLYNGAVVERFLTLTMDPTDQQYAPRVVNSPTQGSIYVTLTASVLSGTPTLLNSLPAVTGSGSPFVLAPVALTSGTDQSAPPVTSQWALAQSLADPIQSPVTVNLAGITTGTLISQALAYCEVRGDAFLVADAITNTGSTPTAALEATAAAGYLNNGVASSCIATYYPRVVIADPAALQQGATRVVAAGGAVLGKYAQTDASVGVQQTAAGTTFGRLAGVLGTEVPVSDADADLLNPLGINAIRSIPGSGICLWGARTGRQVGQADKYISVRRTLIYVKAALKQQTKYALFAPNSPQLWARLEATINQFLTAFWQSGGLNGATQDDAFFVVVDATNNTPSSVASGQTNMSVGIAPLTPAEFLVINISQFNGSVTISEAA